MGNSPITRVHTRPSTVLSRFYADRAGGVALEYGLIISLVIVGFLGGLTLFGGTNGGAWDTMVGKLIAVIKGS